MMLKLLGMDMEKWAIEYAKSGWYPDISAAANYYYRSNFAGDMLNSYHSNWDVGVKASIAIFDGFATKARVDAAKARYEESRIKKDDVVDQLAVDITTACLDLVKAKAVIDAESDSISEAKESLRLANIRFENGVGINLDILDAQVALAQVQQSLAQGIYDYIMAKSQLDRTMGREFSTEESYYARP
jgi:outer membrane protein TolC